MLTDQVTLIAAALAAVASVAGLVLNIVAQSRSEVRQANRILLGPYLIDLARCLHEVMACATILSKARSEESRANWRDRAAKAQEKIKELRLELRYPLWGIHEGLRVISLLPNWLEHMQPIPEVREDLWTNGNHLRRALDIAIRNAYTSGSPPSRRHRRRVNRYAQGIRSLYRSHCRREDTLSEEFDDERNA